MVGMRHDLRTEGIAKPTMADARKRFQEYFGGGRRTMSDDLVDYILLIDAQQRNQGYDGPAILEEDDDDSA
jgi:hypothetical protein